MIRSALMGIFTELHVRNPVPLILDRPALADRLGDQGNVGDGAEVIAPLTAQFHANLADRLDLRDRSQSGSFKM